MAKRERLLEAVKAYARKRRLSYPAGVQRLAAEVGYKCHYNIYGAISGVNVGAAMQHKIAKATGKTVDFLFGEG